MGNPTDPLAKSFKLRCRQNGAKRRPALVNHTPDVALFTRWLWGGGAERVIANLANGLAAQGLAVDLIVVQSGPAATQAFHANVNIIDLAIQPAPKQGWIPFTGFQSWNSLPKLVNYLKTHRPPVLLSATHFINETALLAKKLARVSTRIVVTEHTFLSQEVKLTEQSSSRAIPWTVRALYSWADEVVAVSHGVANDLRGFMGPRSKVPTVIYNSVVTPDIYRMAQQAVDHPWFQQKDLPIVIGAGRFVRQKDFATLLRAFAQLQQTQPARLVLLGSGREQQALQQLASDLGVSEHLWMPGFVDNPYAFLQKADVFALSSAWEGLPTVLIEALALGTPVVSTDCPSGPAEILQQGNYGHLVPVGDPAALATALQAVLQGDRKITPQHWIDQFTPEQVIHKYMEVIGVQPPPAPPKSDLPCPSSQNPSPPNTEDLSAPPAPLVSIIIPAYNAADLIGDALDSIAQQTYPNWQVVVTEDGTHDGTEQILDTFGQQVGHARVDYWRNPVNQGVSATRNHSMARATGQYLAFLDHDDLWKPDHLERLITRLEETGADFAYAPADFFHSETRAILGVHGPRPVELESFPDSLFDRCYIPVAGAVIRREAANRIGGFDSRCQPTEDLDYWLRCIEAGLRIEYIPEVTNGYRQHNPKAITANKAKILEGHARVLRKHAKIKTVSKKFRDRVFARYHLGVVRRSWKSHPLKSWEFLFWSLVLAPVGSIAAVQWFLKETIKQDSRYVS
jgi:glycosyltransferase involved in cell wall biosynthesis